MPAVVIFGCGAVGLAFAAYLFYTVSLISLDSEEVSKHISRFPDTLQPSMRDQIAFCGARDLHRSEPLHYTPRGLRQAEC